MKKLIRIKDGSEPFTLGNIHETEREYIVFDGSDYIGFNKEEYKVIEEE